MGDLRDLLSIFGNLEALTSSAFHRILESYALAIKKLQHEKILAVEHVKKRDTTTIHKLDAGPEISEYICEHCKSPWLKQEEEGKCFACGKTGYRMHKLKDMGLTQEVEGVTWKLKINDKGVTWKIQPKEVETFDDWSILHQRSPLPSAGSST